MAESACLRRSFSNPSESCHDFSQGLRALGESISFGRYMSETLDWGKFSTFSHNRYQEEAEKYSKPGSVAKMKAYFEAHYKKTGARKQAAQEQADDGSYKDEAKTEDTLNVNLCSTSQLFDPECTLKLDTPSIGCELPRRESADTLGVELPVNDAVDSCDSSTQLQEEQNEESSSVQSGVVADNPIKVQVHQCQHENSNISISDSSADNKIEDMVLEVDIPVNTSEQKVVTLKKEAEKENLYLTGQQTSGLSEKRSIKKNGSKLSSSISRFATPDRHSKEDCGTPRNDKVAKLSSSLARLITPIRSKKEGNATLKGRNIAKESVDKKHPTLNPINRSINVTSDVNLVNKFSPAPNRTGVRKVFTPLGKMIRDSFATSPARSRASVTPVSRHPSATARSETGRSRQVLEKSFPSSSTVGQKLKSAYVGDAKSSRQTPFTCSPFNFRTEERAAKRREFFQKRLEKEAEKLQLIDRAKVKPVPDSRKSSQCMNPKAYAVAARLATTTEAIPPSQSQPPKCKSKPAPGSARDKCPYLATGALVLKLNHKIVS